MYKINKKIGKNSTSVQVAQICVSEVRNGSFSSLPGDPDPSPKKAEKYRICLLTTGPYLLIIITERSCAATREKRKGTVTSMYYIGVDLGGTNIAVGIVDENNAIVKKASTPTKPERGADAIVADMAAVAKSLMADLGITAADIGWAGVASPGTVDHERGVVVYANNIPFLDYPLAENLSTLLGGIPVHAENDANAAAKAEAIAGAARGARYSVMITLGTGLGGGIVIDGEVYSGFNFAGAELGHVVIEKDGRQCSCGRKGCWEAYSSATGLVNITKDGIADARSLALAAGEVLDRRNGKDISVLFVGSKINLTDYFVICSGGSETHVRALADEVEYRLSLSGVKPDNREGRGDGNSWIVLDYGSVMVHIFTGEARRFYELDRLFPDAEKINTD